jgi:hypothetical protein
MLDYASMSRRPSIFRDLTGMSREEFDDLHERFAAAERADRAASTTNRRGERRRRAAGAGGPFRLDTVGRLLMALFWLRCYPTYEVLGFFFGDLHRRNAQLNVRGVLAVLERMHGFDFDRPGPAGRRRLSSPEQVMAAFPAVRLIIDAREQRVQRPGGAYEVQKPFYSGKKKCHTVKTQFAVAPDGRIESVSDSHPGGATHDATLLIKTELLDALAHADGEAAMVDKGYVPVKKHLPDRPLVIPHKAARNRPLTQEQKAANQVIAGHRIVVEHAIAQVNRFTVLRQVFRGRAENHPTRHSQVVRVVAGLVNRRIEVCPLKTYAAAA